MASNFDAVEPEPYPGHTVRDDCNCDLCKYERFVYILDRFEAEASQKDWDERTREEGTDLSGDQGS